MNMRSWFHSPPMTGSWLLSRGAPGEGWDLCGEGDWLGMGEVAAPARSASSPACQELCSV